ncbi:MAG: CPBP family intramembrane metalloprotease [Armatimonadetes bacterium]|nr:CPBP family intramembrane metalloprotease [Armatimonadota bacterium]
MAKVLLFWLASGLIGMLVFLRFYPQAFPEASIDFRISRDQAIEIGGRALKGLGVKDFSGYIKSVEFQWHETAKRFLEKTMGLEKANEIMRREVAVWYWYCTWKRPNERRWYTATVAPDGKIVHTAIVLPEEEPGASLTEQQARKIAEAFVQKNLQIDLREWKLVTATQQKRPNRLDYAFVYEHLHKKFPPKAETPATLRFWVVVSGDKVTGYHLRYLHVPEWWNFEERKRQTAKLVLSIVSRTAYALLFIALLFFAIRTFARKEPIPWRTALTFPILVFALTFATSLNYAPLWWTDYDPAKPIGSFVTERLMFVLLGSLIGAISLIIVSVSAELLSRDRPPAGIALGVVARPNFWRTEEAANAIFIGFCVGAIHLGYVTAFYLLGRKVGVWTPLDTPYPDAVATPLPFLVPLFAGLVPALSEELFFRLAAIYLLWNLTKRFWLSALLPNIVWAFLHVGYPPEPPFIRGLELMIPALLYTFAVFRYGIVTPIVAHYTYNAALTSQLLLRAQEPYLWLSGIIVSVGMLLLLLPAAITFLRYRQLPSAADLRPFEPTPIPQPVAVEVPYEPYQPISRKTWFVLAALAAISFAATIFFSLRQPPFKVVAMTTVNRNEAKKLAAEFLKRKGVDVERYKVAAMFLARIDENADDAAYILEHADRATLHKLWLEYFPSALWQVRFFRPLEREEWFVAVRPDGRIYGYFHRIPEEAKGAKLTKAEGQKRAENHMQGLGFEPSDWNLVEADSYERPNRLDWQFIYEHKSLQIAEAKLRTRVLVQGEEAHGFSAWLQVPEAWRFEREWFEAWTDLSAFWLFVLLIAGITAIAIFDWREGAVGYNWRLGIKCALALVPLALLQFLNGVPNWWMNYTTTMPPSVFIAVMVMVSGLVLFLVFLLLIAVGGFDQWMKVRLPEIPTLSLWLSRSRDPMLAQTPLRHPAAWRDAVFFGYIASFAFVGLFGESEANSWLIRSSFLPAIDFFAWTIWTTVILLGLGIAWAGTYRRYIRTPQRLLIVLLLLLPAGLIGANSLTEALKGLGEWAAFLFVGSAILFWLGRYVLRSNLYAWALGIALPILLSISVELLLSPDWFIKAQSFPLLFVYLLPALSLLRPTAPLSVTEGFTNMGQEKDDQNGYRPSAV